MDNRSSALSSLFGELVERHFHKSPPVDSREVKNYVTGLLVDFARAENLYRVRDAEGRRLEDVGEMMIQSNPVLEAPSFEREREVRQHIGDFTLFFSGMFPESIGKWRVRSLRLDSFIDYVRAGKESYHIVAEYKKFEDREAAPLFQQLSEEFESCVYGLNLVRQELDAGRQHIFHQVRDIIM